MTELDWMACADPQAMLDDLDAWGNASERKLRLFACACLRRVSGWLDDERSRQAVEAIERYADGLDGADSVLKAATEVASASQAIAGRRAASAAAVSVFAGHGAYWATARWVAQETADALTGSQAQARLLRDLFGPLPFRAVALDPALLHWNNGTLPAIARHINDERAFHDMTILADALEDAGCTSAEVLAHCRQPGEHVRGCWVVDLLLGRG